ncbi:SpaH/EbpB family LPXTG-anchored major pilin [Mycetocola saprophilus]|uniref:SpaH/EbpB family LPXTG-anchored major pilin n=1 Tax=Mycetocola saprophilus TaxID=76636 RepID=UPI0004C0D58E|nr:SpaH/EbpB family LPXTG-anchored major pilin [Mycetocola saprophilus]
MNNNRSRWRGASFLGAVALTVASLAAGATGASAAPQDFGNIDGTRIGSLTVHKFLQQSAQVEGDISAAPAAGTFSDPVAGVQFTVYPVLSAGTPIDLTVSTNWAGIKDLTPGAACTAPAGTTLGTPIVMANTDATGAATTPLPVGVYQVCETQAPANIIDRAQPFILTVPMPHQGGWVYDVHAYPKNSSGAIEKTIAPQANLGLGSVVTYPVTVPISRVGTPWTGFAIRDTLDARLTPVNPAQVSVTVDGAPMETSHYTVVNEGQRVTFNMTAAGLAWLNEGPNAHVGQRVTVNFAGTVNQIGDGTIPNTATFIPNNPGFDPNGNPPLPSNEVRSYWGNLEILKRATGTTGSQGLLKGAVFEVYAATNPYAADCSASVATGAPISVAGATSHTTDDSGKVALAGLFVSDSQNPAIDATQRCYVLKETAAPAGYVLPANPFTPVAVLRGDVTSDNVEITNQQETVPGLPLTGAAGQVLLGIAALGALGIAGGLVMMRRRRSSAL